MLDRTRQPEIRSIKSILFPKIDHDKLNNGIPMYSVCDDTHDVIRIDLMFSGGVWCQDKPLVAYMTNQMLKEGTRSFSSQQIAEKLDFYGSWLQLSSSYHYSYLTIYCLTRYLKETLAIVEEMIFCPSFPEDKFNVLLNKRKQHYLLDQEKVQSLANKKYARCLYGSKHPYGRRVKTEDFELILRDDLSVFHQQYYDLSKMKIILAGNINDSVKKEFENLFGHEELNKKASSIKQFDKKSDEKKKHFVPKEGALQAAIKIGKLGVERDHVDYPYFKVLTTILGGYFGSRLMSNIREEKGYTYGIGASLTAVKEGSNFSISTETATQHVDALIQEVYNEMDLLQHELVSDDELGMVKSFMIGDAVRLFDGTFSVADAWISLLANDLDVLFYQKQIDAINQITSEDIQILAQKYFVKDTFYEVIAGAR